jgi:hypothetical protein
VGFASRTARPACSGILHRIALYQEFSDHPGPGDRIGNWVEYLGASPAA